jgi:hypothetical protein
VVPGQFAGISQRGANVVIAQLRVVIDDLFDRQSFRKSIKNNSDLNTGASNARATSTNSLVNNDALQKGRINHVSNSGQLAPFGDSMEYSDFLSPG